MSDGWRDRRPPAGVVQPSFDELVDRARTLVASGERRILGLTGPPGAGKSTLAVALAAALGPLSVVVPMDGFHLAGSELVRLGRANRKGASDTFDAAGYVALLWRLRERRDEVVYAPAFRREIEEPIAGATPVPTHVPLVITEGNYLLVADGGWAGVRPLLDEAWYVEAEEVSRIDRLVGRHVAFGKSPDDALAWSRGSDQRNAELIATSRSRADLVLVPPADVVARAHAAITAPAHARPSRGGGP